MSPPLPIWPHMRAILRRCLAHECCAVLLDYDGTLTPIVATPDAARLSPAMARVLSRLVQHPHCRVGIISGRALTDLRSRIDGRGMYLAGNHGLEIEGEHDRYDHPAVRQLRPQIDALSHALRQDLQDVPGALVEDKGLTLSVHVRHVPAASLPEVEARVRQRTGPAVEAGLVVLRTGKAVVEVRPRVPWDKGAAVRWITEQMRGEMAGAPLLTVYVGDDDTDEDAFRVLAPSGIGIVVGNDRVHSAADYYVDSVEHVMRFLTALSQLTWPLSPDQAGGGLPDCIR